MRIRGRVVALIVALSVAGCATPPLLEPDEYDDAAIVAPSPMAEYPPIEPVEPPPEPVVAVAAGPGRAEFRARGRAATRGRADVPRQPPRCRPSSRRRNSR